MIKKIPLADGKVVIVDSCDYQRLSQFKWHMCGGYAARKGRKPDGTRTAIYMHREIARPRENEQVDHKDQNKLNNSRTNLRVCSRGMNMHNRVYRNNKSGFKGVHYSKNERKWKSRIRVDRKSHNLGTFGSAVEAARAYDRAAKKFYGSFALLNFPEGRKND